MRVAAEVRKQLESALAERIPSAFAMRSVVLRERVSCGITEIDAALEGGFPLGGIAELTGPASSGCTTLTMAVLADITQRGGACAYVDVSDSFDPLSGAALGIDLRRLLWVRAGAFTPQPQPARVRQACAPREPFQQTPWLPLDQALRATDLLLNTGGFRAIVLDMGDIRPEHARRVPLATWYRFRLQVEKAQMIFLLLTRMSCAHSCAAVSLRCEQAQANWQQAGETSPPLLTGLRYCVSVERNRAANPYRKKPAASAQAGWSSATPWTR